MAGRNFSMGDRLRDLWLFYEVTFAVYMLEPWEKVLLHVLFLVLFMLMGYTTYHFGIPMFCHTFGIICDVIIPEGIESFLATS
mmetsp:Transcript_3135/g.7560  ORF Transcript_3135/g.7560 Transcript_3135/m.7560 type:complete len:83 (+) Transcript_3135:115-363(+)